MPTLYAALDDRLLVVRGGTDGWRATAALGGHRFECVAAASDAPERVFAGTVEAGLQRSTDGGETWESVGGFDDRVTAVTVSPHDPGVVWVGTEPSAVYRSADAGATFAPCSDLTTLPSAERWSYPPRSHTHHVRWISINPHDPTHVYVAVEAGAFLRSLDGGETWTDHPEGGRRDNHTLAVHPDAPCRVYTAAGDGYAETPDCGDTWEYPDEGLDHRYVWGLAVDAGDPETVVVSASDGARSAHWLDSAEAYVYRRDGDSDRWSLAMDGLPDPEGTTRATLAAGDPCEFYALTNRGLFHSTDAARSWDRLDVDWPEEPQQVGWGLAVV
ncbi:MULTISPECIES: WD40/YVTN/BNR-like repeat-containing protein [Salinibaculum]|uniref:WD40/YVTN/BNR-like repeat-containing protein n=1 Tax=Salinibaculum TaxID=2732368 RepID=UPI0030CEF967